LQRTSFSRGDDDVCQEIHQLTTANRFIRKAALQPVEERSPTNEAQASEHLPHKTLRNIPPVSPFRQNYRNQ